MGSRRRYLTADRIDRGLTTLLYGLVAAQIAVNLTSMFFVSDGSAGWPYPTILDAFNRNFALVHTGYLAGNLICALPAVGVVVLRDRIRAARAS